MSRFDDATAECDANALDIISEEDLKVERKHSEEDEREYDFLSIQSSTAYHEAKEEGSIVVLPGPSQLFIDIDSPEAEAIYNKNKPKFEMHIAKIIVEERKPSRNGNTHIYATLNRYIDDTQRILYQSFLGSDQTRELLSYVRVLHEDNHPTLFIEKPLLLLGDGNAAQ
jgi:hypothetical protein